MRKISFANPLFSIIKSTGIKQASAGGRDGGDAELYTQLARQGYLVNRLAAQEIDSLGAWL